MTQTAPPGYCFRSSNRLANAAAFERVFASASRSRDTYFTVLCRRNDLGIARLGLAIAKRHCRLAVKRNLIKRLVRESFRYHQQELAGLDLIVMNQPGAAAANKPTLQQSLALLWRRCGEKQAAPSQT